MADSIEPDSRMTWGMPRALLHCLLVVNGLWIVYLLLASFVLPREFLDVNGLARGLVRVGVLLIPAVWYAGRHDKSLLADGLGLKSHVLRGLCVGGLAGVVVFVALSLQRGTDFHWGGLWLPGVWVNVLFGSPLAEEILYRGVVYRVLRRSRSRMVSAVISAAWFAVLHLPWWGATKPLMQVAVQTGWIFVYGIGFAVMVDFSRSLWGALIPHVTNNLFFVLMANPK